MDERTDPASAPRPPEGPAEPSRSSGLSLETCYRHPQVVTGVHCTRCGRPICTDCMREAPVGYQCPECVREAQGRFTRRRSRLVMGRPGAVTMVLLAANIGMYLVEIIVGRGSLFTGPSTKELYNLGAMFPPAIVDGQYWRFFTSMFLHAGLVHLALNMYALYLFGFLIEDTLGRARYIAVYFVTGFLAGVTSFVLGPVVSVGVGASGAIFGLLGAWVAYNFRRRESALGSANLRFAIILIGLNLVLGFSIPGIDNFAHLGGLVSGVAAGLVADGFGRRGYRTAVQVAGFAAIVLVGVLLTLWRVGVIQAQFPRLFT